MNFPDCIVFFYIFSTEQPITLTFVQSMCIVLTATSTQSITWLLRRVPTVKVASEPRSDFIPKQSDVAYTFTL